MTAWVRDPSALLTVPPTSYEVATCYYHGHDAHEDEPGRLTCRRCGLGWTRLAAALAARLAEAEEKLATTTRALDLANQYLFRGGLQGLTTEDLRDLLAAALAPGKKK